MKLFQTPVADTHNDVVIIFNVLWHPIHCIKHVNEGGFQIQIKFFAFKVVYCMWNMHAMYTHTDIIEQQI